MKKLLLLTLLCFSINGFAFNWKKVGESSVGDSYYLDVDNIKKHNGFVYYWEVVDLLKPSQDGDYSHISKWQVDCVKEKRTWLSITFYSQPMGKGRINYEATPNKIKYPKPGEAGYVLMKLACDIAK
tara:strand:+ start:52 stop:432 length:381 start_codon:yes stop_codon:yes gene_type:complete